MRIMLDTNIWISLFVFKGRRFEELIFKICLQHTLVMSSNILNELFEVIERKFPGQSDSLEKFLSQIPFETVITSNQANLESDISIRDENDERILISAIDANVDIFITGDKDFLEVKLPKPKILSAAEFLDNY